MIVACPECGARFALAADAVPPAGRRLRCAECKHGWFALPPAADERPPAPPPPALAPIPIPAPEPAAPRPTRAKNLAAAALGLAASAALVALNVPPLDLTRLPWLADLAAPAPRPLTPLTMSFTAARSPLPGNRTLVAIAGRIANPTATAQPVPAIEAALGGGARWRIAPPVATLPAGHSVPFETSAIGEGRAGLRFAG